MRAAVLLEPGKLDIRPCPDPTCPDPGVVIRVAACGICASDARMVASGHPALVYPRIPGHEMAGVVIQSRDKAWKQGDRVQVAPGLRCGHCRHCRRGRDQRCLERQIFGFSRDGGFAQRLAVPTGGHLVGSLTALDSRTGWDIATLIEPAACCLNAQDGLAVGANDNLLIMGGGPLGLLHLIVAQSRAAGPVTVADPMAHRRDAALALGADRVLDPHDEAVMAGAATEADVLILAAGRVLPSPTILAALNRGVRIGVFSGPGTGQAFDPAWVHYHEVSLVGTYGCGVDHNRRASAIIDQKADLVKKIITCRVDLAHIDRGLAHTAGCAGLKAIVEIEDE